MASTDLNQLFEAALSFAKTMLAKEGEFIPFGVSMDPLGKTALVGGDVGQEHPASADVVSLLQSSFLRSASCGAIRAAGVCLDVRVVPPGSHDKSDAICVRLAHAKGEAVEVYVPYISQNHGSHVYGEPFATLASEFRLAEA
jgi:hypothetical protein